MVQLRSHPSLRGQSWTPQVHPDLDPPDGTSWSVGNGWNGWSMLDCRTGLTAQKYHREPRDWKTQPLNISSGLATSAESQPDLRFHPILLLPPALPPQIHPAEIWRLDPTPAECTVNSRSIANLLRWRFHLLPGNWCHCAANTWNWHRWVQYMYKYIYMCVYTYIIIYIYKLIDIYIYIRPCWIISNYRKQRDQTKCQRKWATKSLMPR